MLARSFFGVQFHSVDYVPYRHFDAAHFTLEPLTVFQLLYTSLTVIKANRDSLWTEDTAPQPLLDFGP